MAVEVEREGRLWGCRGASTTLSATNAEESRLAADEGISALCRRSSGPWA